jgi:hypothetical protein
MIECMHAFMCGQDQARYMMAKTKFGDFKPKHLGAEPAEVATPTHEAGPDDEDLSVSALYSLKVPYSSRITVSAQRQLARLGRKGHSQVELLAEALNLLFKKHGLEEVA